jgi:chromate reductase, NAD(P)H dehydrogenase (quinone)
MTNREMTTIVAICGSLREGSSNSALLRTVASLAPPGTNVVFYNALGELPHFNPDLDEEGSTPPPAVRQLRDLLIAAEAILISSPEYAHGVPGAFKNMLDWLVSTGELVGKPVAVLNASRVGGHYAQAAIVETLRTMNWRVVEEACRLDPSLSHDPEDLREALRHLLSTKH